MHIKRISTTLSFMLLMLGLSCPAGAETQNDYNDGMAAYAAANYKEAMRLWIKLADQGHARAQFNLAYMHEFGIEIPASNVEAVKWYQRSAEQGYARAQNFLGWMYEMGKGVEHSRADALKWLRLAADQGSDDAMADYRLITKRQQRTEELKFKQSLLEALSLELELAKTRYDTHKEQSARPTPKELEAANLTG